jgi:hypothetical protein
MTMQVIVRRSWVQQACLTALLACSDGGPASGNIVEPDDVARVEVTPTAMTLASGGTGQLTATLFAGSGAVLTGRSVSWSSSGADIATVSTSGLVTAVGAGTAIITATSGGRNGTAQVTVTASGGAPARIALLPTSATILVGGTVPLAASVYDAQDRLTSQGTVVWSSSNTAVATVSTAGVVVGVAAGTAQVTAAIGTIRATATVTVSGSVPQGNIIDVNPAVRYQTMTGWMGQAQNGWFDCDPTAFAAYRNALHDRVINELGVERVLIPLRSGMENTRDYHQEFAAGLIDRATYDFSWFVPINDNADPFVTDPSRFQWSFLDGYIDNVVVPLRQRMQARGEQLYFVLSYTDFLKGNNNKPFLQMKQPEEFAEFILAAFVHVRNKYGFSPNAVELLLEPEHTPYTPSEMGRAMVAMAARLQGAGFTPDIIAPSTTSMINATIYYDQMLQVPGARGLIDELGYHRYVGVSASALQAIGARHLSDGVKTAMTEHIGSGIDALYDDLTVAYASSWMQYTLAFCGNRDNPANGGVYYQINQTDPGNPKINITDHTKLLRQVFFYVRRGAVRVGATSGAPTTLLPLGFQNTNGKYVVVVRAKQGALFTVRGLPAGRYGINYGTPGNEWNVDLPDQTISAGGSVQTAIPRDGVITIYAR